MKKLSLIVIAVMLAALLTVPAMACGGHRGVTQKTQYSVCSIESCELAGLHSHNRKYYNAHYYGDGHDYHEYCGIEGCVLAGYHEHDGTYCFEHTLNDGHDYHEYCEIEGCVLAGYHEHDGIYCFEHTLNDGHSYHRAGKRHH